MAKPNNGTTTSFESILLHNENVNRHPQLSEKLDAYALAIAGGYLPTENVIDAILHLNPTAAAAQASLLALLQLLQGSGLTVAIVGGDSASFSIDENTTAVTTVVATDPQGDPLTYSLVGADASLFTIDNNGVLSFISAPNFEAPVGGDNTYNVTVQALDSTSGQTDTQAISVTVANVNEAPVAQNDTASGDEDTPIIIGNVLSNDSDVDNTLTVASITGNSQGANGSVVYNNDGTFTYTPNLDFNGSDSFNYTVFDGSLSSTATVDITVNAVDDAPDHGDLLAVAYINYDGFDGYDPSADTLIAGLFDTNGDNILSVGDTLRTDFFPLDFTASSLGEFTVNDHMIISWTTQGPEVLQLTISDGGWFEFVGFPDFEGIEWSSPDGFIQIQDPIAYAQAYDVIVLFDELLLTDQYGFSEYRPLSIGDQSFIDVDFFI